MSGTIILRRLLAATPAITAHVKDEDIIVDDVLPQDFVLPGILLRSNNSIAYDVVKRGERRHVTERVRVETHCADAQSRLAIKDALRNAGDQKFPTRDGLENIAVEFIGHMADGMSPTTFVRMAVTDFRVSYSEPVT